MFANNNDEINAIVHLKCPKCSRTLEYRTAIGQTMTIITAVQNATI